MEWRNHTNKKNIYPLTTFTSYQSSINSPSIHSDQPPKYSYPLPPNLNQSNRSSRIKIASIAKEISVAASVDRKNLRAEKIFTINTNFYRKFMRRDIRKIKLRMDAFLSNWKIWKRIALASNSRLQRISLIRIRKTLAWNLIQSFIAVGSIKDSERKSKISSSNWIRPFPITT